MQTDQSSGVTVERLIVRQRDVYAALTVDYGNRTEAANNVLEFDGLLRVDHVDRFIAVLTKWKEDYGKFALERKLRNDFNARLQRLKRSTVAKPF